MPQNKREKIVFTLVMCALMVAGMSIYNLILDHDLSLMSFAQGYIMVFIIALLFDSLIVGNIVPKVVFSLPVKYKHQLQIILTFSTFMVLGMVTCMSIFGTINRYGLAGNFFSNYGLTWILNLVAALPLQLIIVGPISRQILYKLQAK